MTASSRTYDPVRFHRGTRGFAAFLTTINGFVVLGAALVLIPTLPIDPLIATWGVILGTIAGIASFVAVVGLIRGRRWAASLVGYVAAAGIGVAAFGALLAATGVDIFGADRGTAVGSFVWLIGTWLVAARFAFKPFTFTPHAHRVMVAVAKPVPDARPATGARKRTVVRPVAAAA
jgi:hypothetical protein